MIGDADSISASMLGLQIEPKLLNSSTRLRVEQGRRIFPPSSPKDPAHTMEVLHRDLKGEGLKVVKLRGPMRRETICIVEQLVRAVRA